MERRLSTKRKYDENIYINLIEVPSLEELKTLINNLAKGKVAGTL
jgi:hypothetical protein